MDNLRARAVYGRNGYVFVREENASWDYTDDHGQPATYRTRVAVMRKTLDAPSTPA